VKTKNEFRLDPWTSLDQEQVLVGIIAKVNYFETHYRKENYRNQVLT